MTTEHIEPRFVYDADGNKSEVLLKIADFERLIEALEEAQDVLDFDAAEATATEFIDVVELRRRVFGQ